MGLKLFGRSLLRVRRRFELRLVLRYGRHLRQITHIAVEFRRSYLRDALGRRNYGLLLRQGGCARVDGKGKQRQEDAD